jgi:hypothetical protein
VYIGGKGKDVGIPTGGMLMHGLQCIISFVPRDGNGDPIPDSPRGIPLLGNGDGEISSPTGM